MRRLSLLVLVAILFTLVGPVGQASAATFRNHVSRIPATPTSQQSVRVWMQSDTAFGETAGIEYNPVGTNTFVKVLGTFDASGPSPANWRADIPAFANGTQVRYQLFTRNQSGQDYGFTGFNWSYTVNDGDIQWGGLRHNSFDSYYRSPFGAVPAGTPVTLRLRTLPLDVDGVSVRVYSYNPATNSSSGPVDHAMTYLEDRVEGGTNYAIWSVTLNTPSSPAIWYYKFRITDRLDVDWFSDVYADDHDNLGQGGEGAPSDNETFLSYQLTIFDPAFSTPAWLQNANVYQIFPDRFRNGDTSNDYCRPGSTTGCPQFYGAGSQPTVAITTWNSEICNPRVPGPCENYFGNQFYGGDLWGVIEKLDYIQGLGIDTLYFTPIFEGSSNHRYDTDDYLKIDPALGGDAAFQALVQELKRRGMYMILDGVFNHTSSDSRYFDRYNRYPGAEGACESLGSLYRGWFEFFNSDAPCGSGDYAGWFGYDSLAVLTDNSPAVRDFIYRNGAESVVGYWDGQGVNGWRFDVADEISHNWWRDYRGYAKSYSPQGPLVGEVWPDASKFLLGEQLDSVMNYRFRKTLLGFARDQFNWTDNDNNGSNPITALAPSQFDQALTSIREDYPAEATKAMLNLIDSHDTNRALYVLSILGESEAQARDRLKLAALFQFTYLGAPMVYYGDEAGIDSPSKANGVNGPEDDPYNRAPYPWADEAGDVNVYGPADQGMIAYYSKLGKLRKQYEALRTGDFATLLTGDTTASGSDNDTYAFARIAGPQVAVVAMNQGAGSNSAVVPVGAYFANGTILNDVLNGGSYAVSGGSVSLSLPARSGAILMAAPAAADTTAPTAAASISPAPNAAGWNSTPVLVNLSGSDAGSGVKELRHWVGDGPASVTAGAAASVEVSAEGTTTVSVRAIDNAFNGSAVAAATVKIDSVPPGIALQSRTAANAAGWNGGPVTVTWACTDGGSGPAAATVSDTLSGEGAGQSASGTCADLAGNSRSASEGGINIDTTAPTTSASAPGGWNAAAVSVVLSASDNLSGVAATSYRVNGGAAQTGTSVELSGDGEYTVEFWSVDNAGNAEAAQSVTVKIDGAAPGISVGQSPAPNAAGWNSGPVEVTFTCTPGLSGLASCTEPQTVTAEGETTVTGEAVSGAGQSSSASVTVRIDSIAPTISAAADRAPNAAGWYDAPVMVSFNCDDEGSGVASCAAAQTFGEGAGQSASGSASDLAGNSASTSLTGINVDTTAPTVTISGIASGASFTLGSVPTPVCGTTDALSGVATAATLAITGGNGDGTGAFTASCVGGADVAGNGAAPASVSYTVTAPPSQFAFTGFFQPVENLPTRNAVQAGRTVPIKFSLGGNFGLNVFAAGYPATRAVSCLSGTGGDLIEQTLTAGQSGLSYDAATGVYTYAWKTDRGWGGTCRELIVRFTDGSEARALFQFRR